MITKKLILFLCFLCKATLLFAAEPANTATEQVQEQSQKISDALKASFEKLSTDEQIKKSKPIFESEILSHPYLFLSDYYDGAQETMISVDEEKIKNYLKFVMLSSEPKNICIHVQSHPGCFACKALESAVAEIWSKRLSSRGFFTRSGPTLIGVDSGAHGEMTFLKYLNVISENSVFRDTCYGALYIELKNSETEKKSPILSRSFFELRDSLPNESYSRRLRTKKVKANAEENYSANPSELQDAILTHSMELFSLMNIDGFFSGQNQTDQDGTVSQVQSAEEWYLRVEGLTQFPIYRQFKQMLLTKILGLKLEERIISPVEFQFVVTGVKSLEALAKDLKALESDHFKLNVSRTASNEISVRVL